MLTKFSSTVVNPFTGSLEPSSRKATKAKGSTGATTPEPLTPKLAWRLTIPDPMEQPLGPLVKGDLRMQSVAIADAAPDSG